MKRALLFLILLGIASPRCAISQETLPPPPTNFSWVKVADLSSAFLVPDGWYYTNNKGKLLTSFVIAKEPPNVRSRFETGLTVQAINNMGKVGGQPPSQQIAGLVRGLTAQEGNAVLSKVPLERGLFKGVSIRCRDASSHNPVIYHRLFLANDVTDTLFVITFESPESKWSDVWPIGRTLLSVFVLAE